MEKLKKASDSVEYGETKGRNRKRQVMNALIGNLSKKFNIWGKNKNMSLENTSESQAAASKSHCVGLSVIWSETQLAELVKSRFGKIKAKFLIPNESI